MIKCKIKQRKTIFALFSGFRVDAAKHMWPADIEALQAKVKDVKDGGRPFFYMEVIDLSESIFATHEKRRIRQI